MARRPRRRPRADLGKETGLPLLQMPHLHARLRTLDSRRGSAGHLAADDAIATAPDDERTFEHTRELTSWATTSSRATPKARARASRDPRRLRSRGQTVFLRNRPTPPRSSSTSLEHGIELGMRALIDHNALRACRRADGVAVSAARARARRVRAPARREVRFTGAAAAARFLKPGRARRRRGRQP